MEDFLIPFFLGDNVGERSNKRKSESLQSAED